MSHYSKTDSIEVRGVYERANKKSKGMKKIITQWEWNELQKAGADMNAFEILKDFRKRMMKEEAQSKKHLWSISK